MKGLIELSGELKKVEITFYLPKTYCHKNGYYPSRICEDFGVDAVVKYDNSNSKEVITKIGSSKTEEPFLWILVKAPFAVIEPTCNQRVEITYSFNVFGWISFGLVRAFRYLKGYIVGLWQFLKKRTNTDL